MPAELQALLAAPWLPRMAALAALALFVWQNRTLGRPLASAAWNGVKRAGSAIWSHVPGVPSAGALRFSREVAALSFIAGASVLYQGGWSLPSWPTLTTDKATAATYVYEKDDTPVPVGVSTGLNRLNRERKIRATLFEEDTTDGDGDVPDQYKAPLAAARQQGLPALVVTAGDKVLKVVKDPRTEQQVLEAAP